MSPRKTSVVSKPRSGKAIAWKRAEVTQKKKKKKKKKEEEEDEEKKKEEEEDE
jgi:hypothetical protein